MRIKKVRGRPRTGCVIQIGPSWFGMYTTGESGMVRRKKLKLGPIAEMDQSQARARLSEIMSRDSWLNKLGTDITLADAILPATWKMATAVGDRHSRGAIAELRVIADLLSRGFQPYKAVSPAAPCDLIVLMPDGRVARIEVKSAALEPKGAIRCDISRNVGKFDILAAVTSDWDRPLPAGGLGLWGLLPIQRRGNLPVSVQLPFASR